MNKELIDRAWACLPAEFCREVKKYYRILHEQYKEYDGLHFETAKAKVQERIVALQYFFGLHNLTSDADGEDEMLCVSRKEVIRNFKEQVAWKNHHQSSQHDRDIAMGWCNALQFLFGPKCLPDEEQSKTERL